jgi:2-isopropylmalate synthase
MQKHPITKYRPAPQVNLPNRQWPTRSITKAPIWCSVDLRDGNQALPIPMSVEEKLEMFDMLVEIGFKEIEVGFPSASQIEYDFMRRLVEEKRIPDDVTVQVLVQAREDLIRRTFESLQDAKQAIVHLYNSTNPTQRRVVFGLDQKGVLDLAVKGTQLVKDLTKEVKGTKIRFEYSPESFCLTEVDFATEICDAVCDVWQPTVEDKIILNLPETVQISTPNVYADQIEWVCQNTKWRDKAIISLHTHNDRGTGIAATELGIMAGADRVEGTLFGNGERTGNVDIATVALNLYMQGVDPGLDFSNIDDIRETYERCTRMDVSVRHPYAGELVFTAFSGSHQDAINKGMKEQQSKSADEQWDIPYLPIDPHDLGRSYKAIIRINAQSGKGGVAYVLEHEFGYQMPKLMHKEVGKYINKIADERGDELPPVLIHEAFLKEFVDRDSPIYLKTIKPGKVNGTTTLKLELVIQGKAQVVEAKGNGPIDALVQALNKVGQGPVEIVSYSEHSLGRGAEARAVAYIEVKTPTVHSCFGAAIDTNIEKASLKAVLCALNRTKAD